MGNTKPQTKPRKVISIILDVLTYIFFFICIIALVFSVTLKRNSDDAISIFGRQMRIVLSDSMAECEQTDVSAYDIGSIPVRSMIFIETVPDDEAEAAEWYASIKKGDVLTFKYVYVTQETITHRVVEDPIKKADGSGYIIQLEGDNKASDAETLKQTIDTSLLTSPNYIIGKVTGQSYLLGLLITAAKSPIGIVCIVIIPALIIAVFEIIRLVNALSVSRNKKRDDELEEMRRQLELLKAQTESGTAENTTPSEE